jgi:hypothetical protein
VRSRHKSMAPCLSAALISEARKGVPVVCGARKKVVRIALLGSCVLW